jgi:hypothetical protein
MSAHAAHELAAHEKTHVGDVGPTHVMWARGAYPDRPALPARVSVLILPARGLDTRFVIPCVSSAVHGNVAERPADRTCAIAFLRPLFGLRRSMATGGITSAHRVHPRARIRPPTTRRCALSPGHKM